MGFFFGSVIFNGFLSQEKKDQSLIQEGNGKPLLWECCLVQPQESPGVLQTRRTSSSLTKQFLLLKVCRKIHYEFRSEKEIIYGGLSVLTTIFLDTCILFICVCVRLLSNCIICTICIKIFNVQGFVISFGTYRS